MFKATEAFGEKPDFSGFNRADWPLRNLELHRLYASKYKYAVTKTEQKSLEKHQGCRYSALLDLPYFNPIRMCIIDPMHNLLLGTAKHMICVWKEHNLLSNQQYRVKSIVLMFLMM